MVKAAGGDIFIAFCLFVFSSDLQFISRAGIACHWEDNDVVAQEVYYNVRVNLIKTISSDITFSLGLSDMCMYSTCHCLIISNNKYTTGTPGDTPLQLLHGMLLVIPTQIFLRKMNGQLQGNSRRLKVAK